MIRATSDLSWAVSCLERLAFFRILRRKFRAQVVEGQIYIIERIADLVGDGRTEPPDHGAFFGLLELGLELAGFFKLAPSSR